MVDTAEKNFRLHGISFFRLYRSLADPYLSYTTTRKQLIYRKKITWTFLARKHPSFFIMAILRCLCMPAMAVIGNYVMDTKQTVANVGIKFVVSFFNVINVVNVVNFSKTDNINNIDNIDNNLQQFTTTYNINNIDSIFSRGSCKT